MSLSDFESDLTELSSDEEEYIPAAQKRKKAPAKSKSNDYKVQNALRPPRTTQYTAKSLYDQVVDGAIDLEPEYQRDVVWPDTKQIGLIDSILRNYYMPPVIFAVTAQDDGTEKRTCIDGKQRLTSIQRFMDGLICHKDSLTGKRYWYKDGPGPKRTLLPKQYMQAFANKQITCVEYDSLTDDQEREIFQRVQLGVALTPAERMQANTGPRSSLIREVQSKILGEEGFGDNLDWGHARGRDFQCLASIIYLIENHPKRTFPGPAQLDKWLQTTDSVKATFRAEVLETFKIFVTLVRDKRYNAAFQKPTRVSPIEFTMIGVLIFLHRKELSMMQLSSAIWKMRADVRTNHTDIRANTKVTKTMFLFITDGIDSVDLKSDAKGDNPASVAIKAPPEPPKKAQKRKRIQSSSSDDEEEEVQRKPPPPKASASRGANSTPAETAKLRQATLKKPPAKASATPKTVASRSAAGVKNTTPRTPVPSTSKPSKATSLAKSAVSSQTPRQVAVQKHASGKTVTGPATPVMSTQPRGSGQSGSTPSSAAQTPVPQTPLALPRKLSSGIAKGDNSSGTRPVPLSVKSEPGSEAVKASSSPAMPPQPPAASPIDRLAPLRAARASANALPTPKLSPVISSGSGTHTPMNVDQPSRDILDGMAPIVKRERSQPLSIDTSMSGVQQVITPKSEPSPAITPTLPAGRQIDQASIEKLLAIHGIGKFSQTQHGSPLGPGQPVSQLSPVSVQSPINSSSAVPGPFSNPGPSVSPNQPIATPPVAFPPFPPNLPAQTSSSAYQPPARQPTSPLATQQPVPTTSNGATTAPTVMPQTSGVQGAAAQDNPTPSALELSTKAHNMNDVGSHMDKPVPTGPRDRSSNNLIHPLPAIPQLPLPAPPALPPPPPPPAPISTAPDSSTIAQSMSTSPVERTRDPRTPYVHSPSSSVSQRDRATGRDDRDDGWSRHSGREGYRGHDWWDRDRGRDSGWRGRGGDRDARGSRDWDRDRRRSPDYSKDRDWSRGRPW